MAAAAPAILLPPSSAQSLTLATTRTKHPTICKSTLTKFSPLPTSTSTQLLSLNQRQRRGSASVVVSCLPPASSSVPSKSSTLSTKLYISGLSFRTTEESLRTAFQNFGQLTEVNLVMDRIANRTRGFAFLRYATVEESQRAIEGMHGKFLDGRVIFVEVAKPRSELRQGSKQPPERHCNRRSGMLVMERGLEKGKTQQSDDLGS